MPGSNPGGDDSLAPLPTDTNSPHTANSEPTPPPAGIVDRQQWDEDRASLMRLMQKLDSVSSPEGDNQPRTMIVRFLKGVTFGDGPFLPAGTVTRIDEESALEMLERWPERIECATEEDLREYDAHKAELDQNEVAGQAAPLADIPDVPAPPRIVRFLDHANGTINGRPICRGTIAEIDEAHAWALYKYRTFGLQEMGAKVEWATEAELRAYEALMLQVDQNEIETAQDPLSQQLGLVSRETPKLILRFLRNGIPVGEGRGSVCGEVWPVEKELAIRHLLEKKPIVELATPAELKAAQELIKQVESQSKSQVDARRKHRFKSGVPHDGPSTQIVRLLAPGRFAIHMKQGIIYEKRSDGCETLPCAAEEIWEVEQDFAYRMLREKSPVGTLATEAEWEAYRAKLIGEPASREPAGRVLTGKDRKTPKTKKNSDDTGSRTKFIAILSKHHRYSEDNGLWLEPIESSELVRQSGFAKSTVSEFFKKEFGSPAQYQRDCRESSSLKLALQALRGEISPRKLRQGGSLSSVPNRDEREDD